MKGQNIVSNDHNSYLTITLNYKLIIISEFIFSPHQKILQLLPERIQSRWQYHSIGNSQKNYP